VRVDALPDFDVQRWMFGVRCFPKAPSAAAGRLLRKVRLRTSLACEKIIASMRGVDSWQLLFFCAAVLIVLFQAWRGWRLGLVRQIISLLAIASAYMVAIFGGRTLIPLLRPLGIPDSLLGVAAGAVLGFVTFLVISLIGAVLFKKTSEQRVGLIRFGYGLSGSVIGGLFGIVLVWIAVLGIRVLGTVAETEVEAARNPRRSVQNINGVPTPRPAPPPPSHMVRGLVHMKQSLEQGTAGAVVEQVDPIPGTLYTLLAKIGQMISNEQSVNRFLGYPGVKTLTEHPKIVALQNDGEISRDLMSRNYFALIRNSRIVQAANDQEIASLMRDFEFEKALDYALRKPEKHERATAVR
jgi:uncharacterized membrane protein required for colicin V production